VSYSGGNVMEIKVGDIVKIHTMEWFENNAKIDKNHYSDPNKKTGMMFSKEVIKNFSGRVYWVRCSESPFYYITKKLDAITEWMIECVNNSPVELAKEKKMDKGVELAELVKSWWEEHKYDTVCDTHNVYDEEPDLVKKAKEIIGNWEA
jgi:hypothetical protein